MNKFWPLNRDQNYTPSYYDLGGARDKPDQYRDPLRSALTDIHELIHDSYTYHTSTAVQGQDRHRLQTQIALLFGSAAIIIAITMLVLMALKVDQGDQLFLYAGIEVGSIAIALISIYVGWKSKFHKHWLLNRHIAEQLRLMKFHFLIDPRLWCGTACSYPDNYRGWKEACAQEKDRILSIKEEDLKTYMERQPLNDPQPFIRVGYSSQDLEQLIKYYFDKRIDYQKKYFNSKIKAIQETDSRIKKAPETLFFTSVVIVLIHFSLDLFHAYHGISTILIGFAAIYPIVGLSVKSYRAANQMAPVSTSYLAKANALEDMKTLITEALKETPIQWERIYWMLNQCEGLLAAEHHGWLIMMHEQDITP